MRYRYLDLRTEILQKRLRFRAKLLERMRDFMNLNKFIDVETPTLLRRTPGVSCISIPEYLFITDCPCSVKLHLFQGAREFAVATHHKGLFYSLAQSPQIFKQLLMVGGMDRYMVHILITICILWMNHEYSICSLHLFYH